MQACPTGRESSDRLLPQTCLCRSTGIQRYNFCAPVLMLSMICPSLTADLPCAGAE